MTKYSQRYQQISDPAVLKLLELGSREGIISFAGGMPNPITFPKEILNEASSESGEKLQYGRADGEQDLKSQVAIWLSNEWRQEVRTEEILITSGSQQALDLIARTFVDTGELIAIEDPTYFVALYAFGAYGPKYQIVDWSRPTSIRTARLGYVVSTFQNPTGKSLSQIERQVIAELLSGSSTFLVEDDPYRELYIGRRPPMPIATLARDKVIYVTSFSKIMGPALRLGVVVARDEIIQSLAQVKTGMDLCTSAVTQGLAAKVLGDPRFAKHLVTTRKYYASKARTMLAALKKYMPRGVEWTRPQGGMFVWVTLPKEVDTALLYEQVIQAGVTFVPGYIFRPSRKRSSSLRLSFAMPGKDEIVRGIKILATIIAARERG